MRIAFALVVVVVAAVGLIFVLNEVSALFGIPITEPIIVPDESEPFGYKTIEDGEVTIVGQTIHLIALILSFWIGGVVYSGRTNYAFECKEFHFWKSALIFLVIFGIGEGILLKFCGVGVIEVGVKGGVMCNMLQFGVVVLAFWLARRFYLSQERERD